MPELWDLYDRDRVKTGRVMRRGEPVPPGLYHLVVHVCVFNEAGALLMQRRQPFKTGWPGYWDVSCGGSALAGEDSRQAAGRELREEIGLAYDFSGLRPCLTVHFDEGFDDYYVIHAAPELDALALQYEEVQAVRWAGRAEVLRMRAAGTFIPYRKPLLELLFDLAGRDSVLGRGAFGRLAGEESLGEEG